MAWTQEHAAETAREIARGMAREATATFFNPAMIPYYLLTAGSIAAAIWLFVSEKKEAGIFVGLWPPTFMALSILHRIAQLPSEKMRESMRLH